MSNPLNLQRDQFIKVSSALLFVFFQDTFVIAIFLHRKFETGNALQNHITATLWVCNSKKP